jgi:hypothetical protein
MNTASEYNDASLNFALYGENKDTLFINQVQKTIALNGSIVKCNNFTDFMQTWKFARHVLENKGRSFKELVFCNQKF